MQKPGRSTLVLTSRSLFLTAEISKRGHHPPSCLIYNYHVQFTKQSTVHRARPPKKSPAPTFFLFASLKTLADCKTCKSRMCSLVFGPFTRLLFLAQRSLCHTESNGPVHNAHHKRFFPWLGQDQHALKHILKRLYTPKGN